MAKGGTSSTEATLPSWLETGLQQGVGMGTDIAPLMSTYIPESGPTVAALSPQEQLSQQYTNMAAQSFGMPTVDTSSYLPPVQNMGGIQGYSAQPMVDQMMSNVPQAQRDYIESFGLTETGEVGSRSPQNQPVSLEMQPSGGGK
jgi:hypothetical protein